jgi:hypothetical protein
MKIPYKWGNSDGAAPVTWGANPFLWDDVYFWVGIDNYNYTHKQEKKKLVKIICTIQEKEYTEIKKINDSRIFIEDTQLKTIESNNIDLKIKI